MFWTVLAERSGDSALGWLATVVPHESGVDAFPQSRDAAVQIGFGCMAQGWSRHKGVIANGSILALAV